MTKNEEALSETTKQGQTDNGASITIEWDRKAKKAHWHIRGMTHQETLYVLLDVVKDCVRFAQGETHHHHHEEVADDH
jgi:hypothetical protein